MPDKTLKIMFTVQAVYQTSPASVTYEAGSIHVMREDLALRWVKRGVATDDAAAIAKAEAERVPKSVEVPKPTPAPVAARPIAAAKPAKSDEV